MSKQNKKKNLILNSSQEFANLANGLSVNNRFIQQVSLPETLTLSSRGFFISNNRAQINQFYINFGLIQILIDVPVDDAYKGGVKFTSKDLDEEDIMKLAQFWNRNQILQKIKQAIKWTRLFGGGGLIINTDVGEASKKLNPKSITDSSSLDFYPADMWELYPTNIPTYGDNKPYNKELSAYTDSKFIYYQNQIAASRVIKMKNKEAPSFMRPQLRGWGMSEIERLVRELNSKIKNENVIFEILDQMKLDVVKLQDLNAQMSTPNQARIITERVQNAMRIKNYQSTLVLDSSDEYEQKTLNLAGMDTITEMLRINIASAMRMPMSKIFGLTPTGLNNDDESGMENYNSMIEGEIRDQFDYVFYEVNKFICYKLFGFFPEDLQTEYSPLTKVKAIDEEAIKDKRFERLKYMLEKGLITKKQFVEQVNIMEALPNQIDIEDESEFDNYLEKEGVAEDDSQQNA